MDNVITVTKDDIIASELYMVLASILTSEYYLQLMDRLKESSFCRHKLKQGANIVSDELNTILRREADNILGIDDSLVFALQDGYQNLMIQIARLRPEYVGVINEVIAKFIEQPQVVMDYFGINMIDNTKAA